MFFGGHFFKLNYRTSRGSIFSNYRLVGGPPPQNIAIKRQVGPPLPKSNKGNICMIFNLERKQWTTKRILSDQALIFTAEVHRGTFRCRCCSTAAKNGVTGMVRGFGQ